MPLDSNHRLHHHHHHHYDHGPELSPHHHHHNLLESNCDNSASLTLNEHHHDIDLVTTLRSELAALSYKEERLMIELTDVKTNLAVKTTECENLRAQAARQTALITSLQNRVHASENREKSVQSRCDLTIETVQREKRSADERCKELLEKIKHVENMLANEESEKDLAQNQLKDFVRRLSISFKMEACESAHLTTDCVVNRAEELMTELHRTKAKANSTCDTLSSCENELLNLKSLSNIEKQRLMAQLESASHRECELEARCRQYERDLQMQRDRLSESEINSEKLKDELRGFESRCHRLQVNLDRVQNDRLQFLRCLANQLKIPEPCETLIKDKLNELFDGSKKMQEQINNLQTQIVVDQAKLKDIQDTTQYRLRNDEAQKCELEERLEKCHAEIHTLRQDHLCLSEFLQRLARALQWSECSSPPPLGNDTNIMAESLLERAERLASLVDVDNRHHDHVHGHHKHQHFHRTNDRSCCDSFHHNHTKLRRERSCHDLRENTSSLYNLQRKVRVLKEQIQRRDLHLELLKRKLALMEEGARSKCLLQSERDEAFCRAKKGNKIIEKLTAQLGDARSQIAEVKAQLAEAVEYKITALERARKIDELTTQICDLEEEKSKLVSQLSALKERLKTSSESNQNRRCRDETLINSLRDDLTHLQNQLSDANHRLSHLQNFRTSVARTLHLRDLPETDLLQRLQALCSAHQEFTNLSKRYETASPIGEHPCPRYDDPVPPSSHCRPLKYSLSPEPLAKPTGSLDPPNRKHGHTHSHNHVHGHNHSHGHGHTHSHRYH